MDNAILQMSRFFLGFVHAYGRLTDSVHPLLAIFVPAGVLAVGTHFGPTWMSHLILGVVTIFCAGLLLTIACMLDLVSQAERLRRANNLSQ